MFLATMNFVICLCLMTCTTWLSLAQLQNGKIIYIATVDVKNFEIPENSWWKGIRTTKSQSDVWPFEVIVYKKDIAEDTQIRLYYTIQYKKQGIIWDSWVSLYHDSVFLCERTNNLERITVRALVRSLLGIPKECSVSGNTAAYTGGIRLPLVNKILWLSNKTESKEIRILTSVWDSSTANLFTGDFYIV